MSKSLYICYFGVREPLVQTQVIPYLRELVKDGHEISLLTFESEPPSHHPVGESTAATPPPAGGELNSTDALGPGIEWHWLRYHKWPSVPATAYDIFRGTLFIWRFIAKRRPDILHGRVHIPTLMGALARKFSRHKPKLLFDIRGFFPEEYTDAGIWPENGWLYRGVKRVERWLMKEADGFVVLTENAREILFPESRNTGVDNNGRPVEVIPCCVDFSCRFSDDNGGPRQAFRAKLGAEGRFVITHLGALGGLYLTEEIADLLAAAKAWDPGTFALFLTQTDPNKILPLLRERGFAEADYFVGRVAPAEVQGYLNASDVGLSFVKAGYATASRSPTKIPEYLACGLPVIANSGVGDIDELINGNGVGVLIDEFSEKGHSEAFRKVFELGNVSERCRSIAKREFDLESVGGDRYRRIYRKLSETIE